MLEKLNEMVYELSASVLEKIAFANAAAACNIMSYQPELPQQLKDE